MNRTECLAIALKSVSGQRDHDHGVPESNFQRIASLWNAYLGETELTPADVAAMMALLKIARIATSPTHADSWADLAGYAACGAEVATCGKENNVAAVIMGKSEAAATPLTAAASRVLTEEAYKDFMRHAALHGKI